MLVTDSVKISRYYQALVQKDAQYIGIFYVGVKTTGVFCISTCTARKPKLCNVEFYSTAKELLLNGYRPCKICKPTINANEAPPQVVRAIEMVRTKQKIRDYELRQAGISAELVRRWFKKYYSMTFQAYQRMYRINTGFMELKSGNSVIGSAYDSGYESLSGFGYTFKKLAGKSPVNSLNQQVIIIHRLTTPIGPMFAGATDEGLCLLEFVDRRMLETELRDLQRLLNAVIIAGENKHTIQAQKELEEYFEGKRKVFSVTLCTPGTSFQNTVWNILKDIPFGETRSYQEQAIKAGQPSAVRAVASANGCNRISIIIPCHRVIGKNGNLTGYGGGIERKRWLIDHENQYSEVKSNLLF